MLWWFAQTTLIAGTLAVVATLAGRWRRLGPEARHALWLVVLIKLAIPPFVAWPWSVPEAWPARVEPVAVAAPAPAPVASPAPSAVEAAPPSLEISPQPPTDPTPVLGPPPSPEDVLAGVEAPEESPTPVLSDSGPIESTPVIRDPTPEPQSQDSVIRDQESQIWNANSALLALWLAGSVVVVARRGIKVVRFHRSLAGARPAPGWLVEETRAIGERVGVRPPPVLVSSSLGTPLLWCLGRPRLILPEALIGRLEADRWPGILAHELAHLARRDHWVVRLELLVEAVWWWNPLFWHARRRLHEEAEIACDARVVRALPERRFAYAEALVDVCEHVARSAIPSPSLGVGGAGASHSLEGRLLMILRDPIPHRPTRRGALAALLLAALALPAWTLGQQPEAPPKPDVPPSKPDESARPTPAPSAEPSKPSPADASAPTGHQYIKKLMPPIADLTIDDIRAGFAKRQELLKNLSMRYVVASRDRPANVVGGRLQAVGVQVADVVLDLGAGPVSNYRLDVLSAQANPERPNPGEPPVRWSRRFVVREVTEIVTFPGSWSQAGPVPFRRQPAGEHLGDDLAAALFVPSGQDAVSPDRSIDPLAPRPANVLDLAGAAALLLGPGDNPPGRLDVAGVDVVEGREVVRVAWVGNRNDGYGGGGLRGLLWVAPSLGFAVVRSEAAQDPSRAGMTHVRRTWRKSAGDFVEVGGLWLPRKVEIRSTDAGGLPLVDHELSVVVEDYRVNPELPPDAFHPKFKIEALDEKTGQFTTLPPAPSPGLVDRLAKAIRESKFGPPAVEPKPTQVPTLEERRAQAGGVQGRAVSEPKGAAQTSDASPKSSPFDQESKPGTADLALPNPKPSPFDLEPEPGKADPSLPIPGGRTYADIVTDVDKAPAGRLMHPLPGRVTPAPNAGTPKRAIRPVSPDADAAKIDPGIIAKSTAGFGDPIPISKPTEGDPIPGAAPKPAQALPPPEPGYKPANVLPGNIPKPAPGLAGPITEPRKDDPAPDKAPADQQELERQVENRFKGDPLAIDLASQIMEAQKKLDEIRRLVNKPFGDPAERAAERRLESLNKQFAQLWEARSREFRADLTGRATAARDEIDLFQIRRNRKAADVKKAEAQRGLASRALEYTRSLRDKKGVSDKEVARYEGELAVAEAELASKQTELDEADLLLNQAKRRFGIATPTPSAKEKAPDEIRDEAAPVKGASPDGRDEVRLLQARRDGKAAEMKKSEARLELARQEMQRAKRLMTNHAIGQQEFDRVVADSEVAQADVARKKADLDEADVFLNQSKRRLGVAPTSTRAASAKPAQAATLPELRDAVELMEVQIQGKRAELRGVEAKAAFAKGRLARMKDLVSRKVVGSEGADEAEANAKAAESELETKQAGVLEFEIRLKHARRWAEVAEAQLRRDIERANDRLKWSEDMFKKGFVSRGQYLADRMTYDEYMSQLDPKYVPPPVPAPASADVPASPTLPPDPKAVPPQPF